MKIFKFIVLFSIVMGFVSCGSTKKLTKSMNKENGYEVGVSIPLKDNNMEDNDKAFRSYSSGTSLDWNTAKSEALVRCASQLALKINNKTKTAIENYTKQYTSNSDKNLIDDLSKTIQDYTMLSANMDLKNMHEVQCEITRNTKTNKYTVWLAMEVNKSDIIDKVIDKFENLPSNTKARIEYNKDKFREYLEKNVF